MKTYEWIVFDADETLFHFDAFSGLQQMFAEFGINFTEQDYKEYQAVNKPLWVDYQNGSITTQQLQYKRFDDWANKLQITPKDLNSAFLAAMAEICTPLEGAISLLNSLKDQARLGIITNGFAELQQIRIERTGLIGYFDMLVISEQVGVAKPHQDIFEHALANMDNPARNKVLMVGDNPDTDILGGINAGLDTCWLNIHNKPTPKNIIPHYQVSSLPELQRLLTSELN
ncbi:pyrimidine 5'-nucleotidase [Spartinivicinus ruber]|uniref:pyrimidine 5'-nucleotidase n=1 Tax=Spartinivicinus ruber TaxID=2683272 RepID=UPI0013D39622|nr:pyrimidine 5'-nucleotidase [Spartinivicinus ruber]